MTLFDGLDNVGSLKVLNLFAGIGGNREYWDDCEVTAVELDWEIAKVYADRFPNDEVIVADALGYVARNYKDYDFIWASPPCPTHGQYRHNVGVQGKGFDPVIPDMSSLYGLIVFLKTYYNGKWVVENVRPYYTPLINPSVYLGRHLFWANFSIPSRKFGTAGLRDDNSIANFKEAEIVESSNISNKRQALRNCVDPVIGLHILEVARN